MKWPTEDLDRFFALSLDMLCVAGFDGYFKRLNPIWEKQLGFAIDELLRRPYLEFIHPDDRPATIAEADKIAAGALTISFENRYACKDGSYKWLLWSAAPSVERQEIYAVARDISDRKRMEERILILNADLTTANRELELRNREVERATQLKSQFLSSMSHELRTPLNAILGFSDLLLEASNALPPLDGKQKRWVEHIQKGGKHLLQLINDILDLSKIEAGQVDFHPENFLVASALPEVLSNTRPLAMTKKIRVDSELEAGLIVYADRVRFKQIIYNLLSNAIKFTPEGGVVAVSANCERAFVRFAVKDTGIGIAAADQNVIFDEFRQVGETTRGIKEGTGLGLAITKRLVEQQGGTISVASELGKGTCLTFLLPLGVQTIEAPQPLEPMAARMPSGQKPMVLVVDDDASARELITNYLIPEGYEVATANSGVDAIEKAHQLSPNALTLDILMANGGGWETLHQLKRNPETTKIPIIIVSVVDHKHLGFSLGASEYLVKPIEKDALLQVLRKHLSANGKEQPTCLVVDDDREALTLAGNVVAAGGFSAILAESGKEALNILSKSRVDAVLLDLMMPEMDGFEVLERIKNDPSTRGIPVFVITGKDLTSSDVALLERRCRALLRKTNDWRKELLYSLQKIAENTNGHNRRSGR